MTCGLKYVADIYLSKAVMRAVEMPDIALLLDYEFENKIGINGKVFWHEFEKLLGSVGVRISL